MIHIQKHTFIDPNIPISVDCVLNSIREHLGHPWNGNIQNNYQGAETLQSLYDYINSGIPTPDFAYQGDLFRIHSPYIKYATLIDPKTEKIIGKISKYGSAFIVPFTHYDKYLVSFSKSNDFTKPIYSKVSEDQQAILFHINTMDKYGINICKIIEKYDEIYYSRFKDEEEIMFPLLSQYVKKEYQCTPRQFNYYMRRYNK